MASFIPPDIARISNYRHLQLLRSQGGMSSIYHGTSVQTGQEVIIKFMPLPGDEREAMEYKRRFNQEILIARLADNDHLLPAIDHGDIPSYRSEESRFYLVYPYIKDGSLADLLQNEEPWRTWSLPHIADIVVQAAEGLAHLHAYKIAHQDVKPGNFLWAPLPMQTQSLQRRVHVWVIDFGAAELEHGGKARTIMGTPRYIAPEQWGREVRCSGDQYALALIARLLLTGYQPPLQGEIAPPVSAPLTQLHPQRLFRSEVDRVFLQALAQDPDARFPDVRTFALELQKALLLHVQPMQPAVYSSAPPPGPRLVLSRQETEELAFHEDLTIRDTSQKNLETPQAEKPLFIPQPRSPLPYQPLQEASAPPLARPRLTSHRRSAETTLPSVPTRQLFRCEFPDKPTMFAWSPGGAALVCTFYRETPRLLNEAQQIELIPGFAQCHTACWSPEGRFLALSMRDENHPQAEIHFWDRTLPRERYQPLQFSHEEPVFGLDWSRNGLLTLWLAHELLVYDLSRFSPQKPLPLPYKISLGEMLCDKFTTLRWSADGEWLAAGSNSGQIFCWHRRTATSLWRQPLAKSIYSLSWSADGKTLLAAFANKKVLCWQRQTEQMNWAELPESPRVVSFIPQTTQFAVATESRLLFGQAGEPRPGSEHPGQQYLAWSSDRRLATLDPSAENTLGIWQL